MRHVASLQVTFDDPALVDPPEEYKVRVSFSFGTTELRVTAVDEQTGWAAHTEVVLVAD